MHWKRFCVRKTVLCFHKTMPFLFQSNKWPPDGGAKEGMKQKRRIRWGSALLSLALLLSLLPGTAWAGTVPEEPTVIQMDGETLKKGDEAWTADDALALPAGSYRLDSDITTDKTISVSDEVTLDLNGFGIRYSGTGNASVITVTAGTLTLTDSNTTKKHYITLVDGRGTAVGDAGEVGENCIEVTGGYITGGTGFPNGWYKLGGGVYVSSGTFTMSGGTINDNTASDSNGSGYGSGGGKFGPNDSITREQLATILYRYAQSKG